MTSAIEGGRPGRGASDGVLKFEVVAHGGSSYPGEDESADLERLGDLLGGRAARPARAPPRARHRSLAEATDGFAGIPAGTKMIEAVPPLTSWCLSSRFYLSKNFP